MSGRRSPVPGCYCTACGTVQGLGPGGLVTCRECGKLGLRFYRTTPRRVTCPVDGCAFAGWEDGGVNDDLPAHRRRAHGHKLTCEWCRGTGLRRSRAKDAVDGHKPCRACNGEGVR